MAVGAYASNKYVVAALKQLQASRVGCVFGDDDDYSLLSQTKWIIFQLSWEKEIHNQSVQVTKHNCSIYFFLFIVFPLLLLTNYLS